MLVSFVQINLFICKKKWVFYSETFACPKQTAFHIYVFQILLKKKIQHLVSYWSTCALQSIDLPTLLSCAIWLLWAVRRTRQSSVRSGHCEAAICPSQPTQSLRIAPFSSVGKAVAVVWTREVMNHHYAYLTGNSQGPESEMGGGVWISWWDCQDLAWCKNQSITLPFFTVFVCVFF